MIACPDLTVPEGGDQSLCLRIQNYIDLIYYNCSRYLSYPRKGSTSGSKRLSFVFCFLYQKLAKLGILPFSHFCVLLFCWLVRVSLLKSWFTNIGGSKGQCERRTPISVQFRSFSCNFRQQKFPKKNLGSCLMVNIWEFSPKEVAIERVTIVM